jgi:hypothetical protein
MVEGDMENIMYEGRMALEWVHQLPFSLPVSGSHLRCNWAAGNVEGIQQNLLLYNILTKELKIM